ncbi:protein-methionine-sulfoxide reductase heme-binding subunit MsrQ [Halovulum sp. GXIMD14793]
MSLVQRMNGGLRRVPIWPLYAVGFVPAIWLFYLAVQNRLGADPVKVLEHESGEIALQFLVASLMVTPILRLTRINLMRFRRWLGLMAFYYAALHVAVYLMLDLQLNGAQLLSDLTKRPYIIAGTAALVLMIPLALTSNNWALRRMGGALWRKWHRLVYPAAILAALHYIWLVKAWPPEPLIYAGIIGLLLAYRAGRGRFTAPFKADTAQN